MPPRLVATRTSAVGRPGAAGLADDLVHADGLPNVPLAATRLDHAGGRAEAGEAQGDVLAREGVGVVSAHLFFFPFSSSSSLSLSLPSCFAAAVVDVVDGVVVVVVFSGEQTMAWCVSGRDDIVCMFVWSREGERVVDLR